MRLLRALAVPVLTLALGGCGYVHFGRWPKLPPSDSALQQSYLDLTIEQKVLKQELALARKETDTLRAALEKSAGAPAVPAPEMARQLEETTRELATLRASYAKLSAERSGPAPAATSAADAKLAETQEKLVEAQRGYAQLQDENARLKQDLDATRSENAMLARQLKASVAEAQQSQATVAQLNTEVDAQKRARERAEQANAALRAQLEAVMARADRAESAHPAAGLAATISPAPGPTEAPPPATAPVSLAALQRAKEPPSGAVPIVELRTNGARLRGTAGAPAAPPPTVTLPGNAPAETAGTTPTQSTPPAEPPAAPPATPPPVAPAATPAVSDTSPTSTAPAPAKTYTVQRGDTLEKIAEKFYGAADQWGKIFAANADALSASGGLKPGMNLQIPEK